MRALFVCSGNTCRSPMAEAIGRRMGWEVRSAGTHAAAGAPVSEGARRALGRAGLSVPLEGSARPRAGLLAWADIVLTMERAQRDDLHRQFPWARPWTLTIGEWAGHAEDVADPVGGGDDVYDATLHQIEGLLQRGEGRLPKVERAAWAAGSDHAGMDLKDLLARELDGRVIDVGTRVRESSDYPDFAEVVAWLVATGRAERGLLVCGTGIGMSIAANKIPGIRAAAVWDVTSARLSRQHNDANVICLGERLIGPEAAKDTLAAFAEASFDGGRHQRRIEKIRHLDEMERGGRRDA